MLAPAPPIQMIEFNLDYNNAGLRDFSYACMQRYSLIG
jgi:hypothetical protein